MFEKLSKEEKNDFLIIFEKLFEEQNISYILLVLKLVVLFVAYFLPLIIAVAYFTLLERQILASVQRRQGPNVLGFLGLVTPLADGIKLILKESIAPKSANFALFNAAPIFIFALALLNWLVIPFGDGLCLVETDMATLFIFAISSLAVHGVIIAGWSSNSKYAFLGALRSAAQMVSYELTFGLILALLIVFSGSLNFTDIVLGQKTYWHGFVLFPVFIIFFISILAETNRHPFDLPEAESELVSGYNVEYAAMGFALFFLAEYANIILMSVLAVIFFGGGWHPFIDLGIFNFIPSYLIFSFKTIFFIFLFVFIRAAFPRYRYDQLMRLGWKVYLPITLYCLIFYVFFLYSHDSIHIF